MARADDPVRIVAPDPSWPAAFESERKALAGVFGSAARIEHVGSTAVPGLAAKPIIDILLGADSLAVVEARIGALEGLGYAYVPEFEEFFPKRRFLRKPAAEQSTHHLHCVETGSDFWREHLLFRDHLRAHPGVARQYGELKQKLAVLHGTDREAYTAAKSTFVARALRAARAERG